uniref:VHS domain-containing protein n=1 Tax=Romanomermis culicivorax TaxID=13658 RepID=A0A915JY53_ROMCU
MGKNNKIVLYTLTVLETCVKNCDIRLVQLITQKEFCQDLIKLIGSKYDPPAVVQEKVLGLIQSWADAFRGKPDFKGVCEVYDELKAKGVDFPMTDVDSMVPIVTPKKA